MKKVRLGIVGVGNMGSSHAGTLLANKVSRCELAAVCDLVPAKMEKYGEKVRKYTSSDALIKSGDVDAVVVATPHYDHTTIGIAALKAGLHVLVEKPVSVHKADCQRLIAAHKSKKQVFCAMFNQRTDPHYSKVRDLLKDGALGKLMRMNWIITNWFRTNYYYESGDWRATWGGEGGGVLLNQCPHNLDLLQWICGMPSRVQAVCRLGKWHPIEVEDDVTAYLTFPGGATGVFVTSTGEAPGTNRLELVGENGKIVVEHGKIQFTRNVESALRFCATSKRSFAAPEVWNIEIPVSGSGGQHLEILQNFVNAILDGVPLLAPAEEGINSVELANAMLYSSFTGKPVDLPMKAAAYETELKKLIKKSRFKKKASAGGSDDLSGSFSKV
jgi:predicted dehydrogenase